MDIEDFRTAPQEWSEEMWRDAIKAVVRFAALPDEDLDDIVSAGWLLGEQRAKLLNRRFWPGVDPQPPLMLFVGGFLSTRTRLINAQL